MKRWETWETDPRASRPRLLPLALTSPQASMALRQLHGQAELKRQLGLPGRAASSQFGDAVQGQPAAEQRIQHGAAQAQALVLLREQPLLPEQVQRWEQRGWEVTGEPSPAQAPHAPRQGPSPAGILPRPLAPHARAQHLCKRHVPAGVRRLPSAGAARQGWKGGSVSADLVQKDAGPPSLTSVWLKSQNQSQDAVRCAVHGDSDAETVGDHQLWERSGQRPAHLLPEAARTPG